MTGMYARIMRRIPLPSSAGRSFPNVAELPVKSPDGGLVVNLAGIFPDEGTRAGKQQCPLDRLNAK